MIKTWTAIFRLFSKKEQHKFFILLLSSTLIYLFDVVGFASVMPFIAVAVNPEIIQTNAYINYAYITLGFTDPKSFLVFLGFFAFTLLLLVKGLYILDSRYSIRFWYKREYKLSVRLLQHYLNQHYAFFLKRNTAELSKIVLSEVDRAVSSILMSSVDLFASIIATLFLFLILVLADPLVAFTTVVFFSSTYIIIFFLINRQIKDLGKEYVRHETEMFKRIKEALEGVKQIKVLGRERFFTSRYSQPKNIATINATKYGLLALFPEQILETVAFGGIIMVTIYFTIYAEDTSYALPLVALYAFAAYRLLPYIKSIFDGLENMQYHSVAVNQVLSDFSLTTETPSVTSSIRTNLSLSQQIELSNVSYRYPNSDKPVIENLDTQIKANTVTCIFGQSGAGKTTTVDIILGLLTPCQGEVIVDDIAITASNLRAWQRKLGYVSHSMFLTDDTIAENIAFGISREEINYDRVAEVAKIACIHDFISKELSDNYKSIVGEKGLKLSAGQRQRICIARALYRDPEVLVLDEATNALDKATESAIINTLIKLKQSKTIIFISHKPTLAAKSDSVIFLDRGKIIDHGTFNELANSNDRFRSIVKEV